MEEGRSMVKPLPMNGGNGIYSYSKNSLYQKCIHDFMKERIKEVVSKKFQEPIFNPFRIADFGCGTGSNTFYAMQTIIEAVQHKCPNLNMEFQVFFNDYAKNDFNTLLTSLPSFWEYYTSIVSGSFHGRLFSRASINMAYSNCALHWLSQVPESIFDNKSAAWNAGRIYYEDSVQAVVDAYAKQFEKDMRAFLNARAKEIVSNGLLVTIFPGKCDELCHTRLDNVVFHFFSTILIEMAYEGIIEKAKIDAFNVPVYMATVGEMKQLIKENEYFNIERIETVNPKIEIDESINAHSVIKVVRALSQGLLSEHFGGEATEKMFEKAFDKCEEISEILLSAYSNSPFLFIVLKRK